MTKQIHTSVYVFILTLVCLSIWFAIIAIWRNQSGFKLWFFDVGQGDSMLIDYKGRQILIDGGPDDSIIGELGRALLPWDDYIDMIVISHLHADHITGVIRFLDRYRVGKVFVNQTNYESPFVRELNRVLSDRSIPMVSIMKGDHFEIADLIINVLWPTEEAIQTKMDINDSAVVLGVSLGNPKLSLLLPSDFEFGENAGELDLKKEIGKIDILKVPHQGSSGGITDDDIVVLNPSIGIISVGKDNQFGHPHPDTIQTLIDYNVDVLRTDMIGTILVECRGGSCTSGQR